MECPDKSLDLRSADRSIPFLGLKVHNIKSKTVFADHAVDALVTGPADRLPCVLPRPSVTHLQEQLDNEAFKELRGRRFDAAQEFGGKAYPHLQVCYLQSLLRRLLLWLAGRDLAGHLQHVALRSAEFHELWILFQELDIDTRGSGPENFATSTGNLEMTAPRGEQQSGLLKVALGPGDAIRELRLPPAGQRLFPIGIGELELGGQDVPSLRE